MKRLPTMLSGAVTAPPPLPFRPPKRDGDMPWEEAIDRHRHHLAHERLQRSAPWNEDSLDAAVAAATERLVQLQAASLDLVDEGGLEADTPLRAHARLWRHMTLEAGLETPLEWVVEAAPPRLTAPPVLDDERCLRRRWERAQRATAKPVKLSVMGPHSFAGRIDDPVHGPDLDAATERFADALNPALRQLAEAGCPAVELVEPALLVATPAASPAAFEAVARTLHRVPRGTFRWLRLAAVDQHEPWLGPPPPTLNLATIAPVLEDLPIDGLVLEPAWALAAVDVVAGWRRLSLALIVVPGEAGEAFGVDDASEPLARAQPLIEPGRLWAAVDGGWAAARVPLKTRLTVLEAAVHAIA